MSFSSRTRPSPAMIIAALALVLAMAGTAIAGPDAITSAITGSKVKKIAKKQAKKQIKKAAPGLSVAHADTADLATDAQTAANADNATNAQNADALGGVAASGYVQRLFAKVAYSNANPTIIAGSPGITASGEGALGFPRVTFPQSMNNCAIIAMTSAAAGTSIVRHSTGVGGTLVQLAIQNGANAPVRTNFSIVGIC